MPVLSDEQYEKIISDYLSGMTQKEAGEANGIGRDAVGKILKRFEVPIREYTGERLSTQKWIWDFDFFERRTELSSYWAGFLMADGNINNKGNIMALVIQERDLQHLYDFCDHIKLDRNAVYKDSGSNAYGIHLNNKNLGRQLELWGIIPRKSKNFHEPYFLYDNPHLICNFLRGWIDGDGSVYRYGRSARIRVSSGNKESLEWFTRALEYIGYDGYSSISEVKSEKYPGNYILYIGGVLQVAKVCQVLQVDDRFCMERKWTSRRD